MSYLNGKEVFPLDVLELIQRYAQGTCVYIPRNATGQRPADTPAAAQLRMRNAEICGKYAAGQRVRRLSEEYCLSTQAIYKIIAEGRK